MSIISTAFKGNQNFHYLVELDLDGHKHRFATTNLTVPYVNGIDLQFKGKLKNEPQIISNFDFRSFRHNASTVKLILLNDERLQDIEIKRKIDYGTAKIWLWCEGLDWEDIEDKPVFWGGIRKDNHTRELYTIDVIDFVSLNYDALTSDTFTGTPGDVVAGILDSHTSLSISQISYGSAKDLDSVLSSLSLSVLVDERVDTFDLIDRILGQCKCSRVQTDGKVTFVTFDLTASAIHFIGQYDLVSKASGIYMTPIESICNNLSISYGPIAGAWGTTITRDETNNSLCKRSYMDYGRQPQRQLLLADCDGSADAEFCIDRHLSFFAYRHDLISLDLQFYKAWDMREGDIAEITLEEGSSLDGNGWVDERFMLMEKSFMSKFIRTKWWRIDV